MRDQTPALLRDKMKSRKNYDGEFLKLHIKRVPEREGARYSCNQGGQHPSFPSPVFFFLIFIRLHWIYVSAHGIVELHCGMQDLF